MNTDTPTVLDRRYLDTVRASIQAKNLPWKADKTFFYNFSLDTLLAGLRYRPHDNEKSTTQRSGAYTSDGYIPLVDEVAVLHGAPPPPVSLDWTNRQGRNFIDPVKSQGLEQTCVAHGVVAAVMANARIEKNLPFDDFYHFALPTLSEHQLFICGQPNPDFDLGWNITEALDYCRDIGLIPNYFARTLIDKLSCALDDELRAQATRIREVVSFDQTQVVAMKQWLDQKGPLITSLLIPENLDLLFYRGGVYEPTTDQFLLNAAHCVCIVGYDDERQAWKIKNSWGTDWGENGFGWIRYHKCYLETQVFGIDGVDVFLRNLD